MQMMKLKIKTDTEDLQELFIKLGIEFQTTTDASLKQVSKRIIDLFKLADEIFTVDVDYGSTCTSECLVTFQPTDAFARFTAAVVARDIDSLLIEHNRLRSVLEVKKDITITDTKHN